MRRLGLLAALVLLAPVTVLAPPEVMAEQAVDSAFVKLTLTLAGTDYAHPGFRLVEKEEGVFVIEVEGKSHEITVLLRDATDSKFKIHVDYVIDGKAQLGQDLEVEVGKPATLSKGETKLVLDLDPRGDQDKSRKDEDKIDQPEGDDPLGGM